MKNSGFLLLCVGFFLLSGCNTVAGVGRDVQKAGEALERTADYARTTPPSPEILEENEIDLVYPPAMPAETAPAASPTMDSPPLDSVK